MKWGSVLGLILLPMTSWSFSLTGTWRPENITNIMINVQEKAVVGTMTDNNSEVHIDIGDSQQTMLWLNNIRLVRKPWDWYNFYKYKQYIHIFRQIQKHDGIMCGYMFIDKDNILVEPYIGNDKHQFMLLRTIVKNEN